LNAAGRLESAQNSYGLLISREDGESKQLASDLNKQNTQRQEQTRSTQQKASEVIGPVTDELMLIVIDPDFNEGIVGLAASRLTEQYHRPAIVGVKNEETTRCSCRSIPDFHITRALDECKDLLIRHGGHAAAAGFTVSNENLDTLITRLKLIAERELKGKDLTPVMTADAVVEFSQINPREMFTFLDQLQPVGYGNRDVILCSKGITVTQKRSIGSDNKHLKMVVTDGWQTYDCIAFGFGYLATETMNKVDILYSYELNVFNGRSSPQLNIKDIHLIK
jgi:single-stranded-DNA-specific exonuclease